VLNLKSATEQLVHVGAKRRECNTCGVCLASRRVVSGAISAFLDRVIVNLERHRLDDAALDAALLLNQLDDVPESVVELVGEDMIAQLREGTEEGLQTIGGADRDATVSAFRSVRIAWLATYPPFLA
jgi:hypothetical protein